MNAPKNLLMIRTDRIGDVILSLPLAEIVKRKYPGCKVSFLVREYTSYLVKDNPFIDHVLVLKERNNKILIKENISALKQKDFDTCIIVYPTFFLALTIFLSGIKNRIGTGYRWYSFFFNSKVFEHRKYAEKHELEYNIGLLRQIGISENVSPGNINFHLKVKEEEKNFIKNLLEKNDVSLKNRIVIIHPGSGGSSIDLPIEKMILLTQKLSEIENLQILITGNKFEAGLCGKFVVNTSVKNLAGKLNLSQLSVLISIVDLFISNSTGPIHIAAALDKYVIGFYPKILACSMERWGPYTEKRTVFIPTIDCSNCSREQCEKLDCMNSIDIGRVFDECKRVLKIC
jgi:ADP-heptose:LPS heptosyltransferase